MRSKTNFKVNELILVVESLSSVAMVAFINCDYFPDPVSAQNKNLEKQNVFSKYVLIDVYLFGNIHSLVSNVSLKCLITICVKTISGILKKMLHQIMFHNICCQTPLFYNV